MSIDRDLENQILGSQFSNPDHKSRLKKMLFEGPMELSPDDLSVVTGGVQMTYLIDEEKWDPWPKV